MEKVYFMNDRAANSENSLVAKMLYLFEAAGFEEIIKPGDVVAIKLHMGEYNNTAYIRPVYVRALVDKIKSLGGDPMVLDTTTLLGGHFVSRATALDYYKTAERHGFNSGTVGCPVIIADGYLGTDDVLVELPEGVILKEQYVATAIAMADAMIALTHFKGHPIGVFGGSMKNIGVGCASKRGKFCLHLAQHPKWSMNRRSWDSSVCKGDKCPQWNFCRQCCPQNALYSDNNHMVLDNEKCIACFACFFAVTCGAYKFPSGFFEAQAAAIIDSAKAVSKTFAPKKIGYINLAIDIAPWCDCCGFSDRPLIPNIGVFASYDPVALDTATVQKALESVGMPGSTAESRGATQPGTHKFTLCSSFGRVSEDIPLNTGEKNGLGSRKYELVELDRVPTGDTRFTYPTKISGPKYSALFAKKAIFPEKKFAAETEVDFVALAKSPA